MTNFNETTAISIRNYVLPFKGMKAFLFEFLFVATAVILPALTHLVHAPVLYILPMHWPVIFAGLVFGWRAGALTGIFAPVTSYLLSGMPLPVSLPLMTAELFAYGFVTGLLREKFHINSYLSVIIALLIGRIVFISMTLFMGKLTSNFLIYIEAVLLPGIVAAIFQIILLPKFSNIFLRSDQQIPNKEE